jgi:hypothetical protein
MELPHRRSANPARRVSVQVIISRFLTKGFIQYLWGGVAFRVPAASKPQIQKQLVRFAITQEHLFPQ